MQSILQHRRLREGANRDFESLQTKAGSGAASHHSSSEKSAEEGKAQPVKEGTLPGVQTSEPAEDGSVTFEVGWADDDPENPQNWTLAKKWWVTTAVCLIALAVSIPASIDGPVAVDFNSNYHVGAIAGSMTTGMYLIGIGVGSMFAAPFSETFGRNLIYFSTLTVFMLFTLGKALAPNYGGAIVFRFLVGFFGAAPLTVGGGTVGDVWGPLEVTFSLPYVTMTSYCGPILGPIIGAYLPKIGFRWADWISMFIAGIVLIITFLFQPETYSPALLDVRAKKLRELTGDSRYHAIGFASADSMGQRMRVNLSRPFTMIWTEPIILLFSMYLIIIYIVLFTFLNGFMIWTALLVGDIVAIPLIPLLYGWTKKAAIAAAGKGEALSPEVCLWFSMMGGSILMPISLFWIGWSCYANVSIWAPIIGVFVFGYSIYVVFVYLQYAGSALSFMTFSRYVISGALMPASVPMYENIGPHVTLTWLGAVTVALAPLPFVLYKYGHKVRSMSKNVQNKG